MVEALPPFLLAFMAFLVVEHIPRPLEATLVIACFPTAGHLMVARVPLPQRLARLAQLGEHVLMLEVAFFFLNLSPESLAPTWGGDIRHGMHYSHINMWLVLAPALAVVWSRSIFHQLGLYALAPGNTDSYCRMVEAERD
jgi:hypothetical protein